MTAAAPVPLRLRLPAQLASVETARLALLEHLAPWSPSPRMVYGLELVLEEILMNITLHAYAGATPGDLSLTAQVRDGSVLLSFEDEGRPFDPRDAAVPTPPGSLDEAVPGGLGLDLVRRHAKAIDYERRDGRNRLSLRLALA